MIIRLKHIGDALLSLPVCVTLKSQFPQAEIHYLVYEHIAPLFVGHPAIAEVKTITPAERRRPWQYLKKMMSLRREKYDMVIDLLTVPVTALTTRLSGAANQIGFDKGKWRSYLYKTRVTHKELGALDSKLAILDGLPYPIEHQRSMTLVIHEQEREAMKVRLRHGGLDLSKPILLISPISRVKEKKWSEGNFVELIGFCLTVTDAQALFIWGPGEQESVQRLAARVQPRSRVFADVVTGSVRDLAVVASHCALFIGNDSGPRHIAEAVGIPTFTIFSPGVTKNYWIPNLGELHRGVDITDLTAVDKSQSTTLRPNEAQHEYYYRALTPQLVIDKLRPMLAELSLAQSN